MYGKLRYILLLVFSLGLTALPVGAQESVGLYNSVKGFGAVMRTVPKEGTFHSVCAFVDIYGVPTSRCSYPGIRVNASRYYTLGQSGRGDIKYRFYAGPGVTAGYVRDHDKGRGIDLVSLFGDNEGVALALSGGGGCLFDFGSRVCLDLSLTADIGVHIRRNEDERGYFAPSLSIYNNGLIQALYPQLTILFKL